MRGSRESRHAGTGVSHPRRGQPSWMGWSYGARRAAVARPIVSAGGRSIAVALAVAITLGLTSGCVASDDTRGDAAREPAQGTRVLEDPVPVGDGGPRVLVYHDMEGLSGQSDPNSFRFAHPEAYAEGRELLTADVNAVVEGLFEGGAAVVHVVDAHGSGNPEPDILLDRLDPRAEMVFRDEPFRPYVDLSGATAGRRSPRRAARGGPKGDGRAGQRPGHAARDARPRGAAGRAAGEPGHDGRRSGNRSRRRPRRIRRA